MNILPHLLFLCLLSPAMPAAVIPLLTPKIVQSKQTRDCWINLIEDAQGNQSIVKQIKNEDPCEQFLLVIDALACSIAQELNIPVNKISLIPPGLPFPGKHFPQQPATVHTLAPGIAVAEELPWPDFDIHQKQWEEDSPLWYQWGPLSPEDTGLTPAVIYHMSLHPALASIVALDTFLGNGDRSNPNIFYDPTTNSFCGIDMAGSFDFLLAGPACFQLKRILKGEIVLSKEESCALERYRLTLRVLLENYSTVKLCKLLELFAQQAGFYPGSTLFTQSVQDRMQHHKNIIKENYQNSRKLFYLLNKLREI